MTDFGGLANMIQKQSHEISSSTKGVKNRKKSLELPQGASAKVNPKLLQILKDNQDEFAEEQTLQLDQKTEFNIEDYTISNSIPMMVN